MHTYSSIHYFISIIFILTLHLHYIFLGPQEADETCSKEDGSGEKLFPAYRAAVSATSLELAPILMFSHLLYHQSSPCSAERHKKRPPPHTSLSATGEDVTSTQEAPAKRSARKNLSVSLPPHGPATATPHPADRVPEEGVLPLQSTPLQREQQCATSATDMLPSCPPPAFDFNTTFEVPDGDDQMAANSTFVVPAGVSETSGPTTAKESVQSSTRSLLIPSLVDLRRAQPPYMAMTSAAQRKRKLTSGAKEEEVPGISAPKRVRQLAIAAVTRPLRVKRGAEFDENKPRRVLRSVSEGNLTTLVAPKSRSIFYKTTQQFKRVTKRM